MDTIRCLMVLCFVLISTTSSQIFHVVAPNTLRLDSDETIAIAQEGSPEVEVKVLIQDYPGKIKNLSETVLDVKSEQPEIFKVRLNPTAFPTNFLSNPSLEKFVLLTVTSVNFRKEIQIPISNTAGYIFIQTDKPIYTPKEMVHFRIIALNEDELPSDKPFKLQIRNSKNLIVQEKVFNKKFDMFETFKSHLYKIPNYPVLGKWSATVLYGHELEQDTTVNFELREYVLPTFTVDLKTPEVILESQDTITWSVSAKYVYGQKVKGFVTYRLGVKGEAPHAVFFAVIGPKELREGFHQETVRTRVLANHQDIGWFPGIEGSHLIVEATVVDDATGNKEVVIDARGRFSKSPFLLSFKRCLQDFRPGLVSVFEADVNYIDGKPAAGIATQIKAVADGKPLAIAQPYAVSDKDGKVSFEFHPQVHHNTISITVETVDLRYIGSQVTGNFVQHRFMSKENAFIALERSSVRKLKVNDTFHKIVYIEPPVMKDIYYAVLSKGKIVRMSKLPEGDFLVQRVEFQITHEMVPSFRLVAWAHYKDELIADSLHIDIEDSCHPKAEVSVTPEFEVKEPGSVGVINIRGTRDALVGLLGVDEAVYALSKKDLLTKSKIFKTMDKHDLGCGAGGGLTTEAVLHKAGIVIATNKYTPKPGLSSCAAITRKKREVASEIMSRYTGLEKECCALGLNHDPYNRNCEVRTNIVKRYLQGEYQNCSEAFLECCMYGKENGFKEMKLVSKMEMPVAMYIGRIGENSDEEPDFIPISEEDFDERQLTVRSDFRETWFFNKTIGPDNKEEFPISLPQSITTWVIQAVSVSPYYGMCVAEPQKLVIFKKVFVQLDLPYSVVRNEQVVIPATVFNYGFQRLSAIVYMYGVKDLCTGTSEGEKSERKRLIIEKNSAATVTFPVIPLKEGTFNIKVVALTSDGTDIIVRKLNVVAEGEPVEVNIPIMLDPLNQQRRLKRHISTSTYSDSIDPEQKLQITAVKLSLPEDFVPGTESCSITAIGDQFGATVETALNDPEKLIIKPGGCGEQNMAKFAPTLYTMRYLKVKGKITPEIEEKGYGFIRYGYQNQLSYRKDNGSYAVFPHSPTSTWLTAFVIKVFCQATELIPIDEEVMCSGVRWLINNQQPDGSYIERIPRYNMYLMGGVQGKTPLTAFVLITLEECKCEQQNLHITKKRALAYLEDHLGDVNEPLAVAIMAYALSLSDSVLKQAANDKLMSIAKRNEDNNFLYWGTGDKEADIETTSYGLLNQLLLNNMEISNSIVNWLNTQRTQSGSFKSTQDTVVALQALSEYAIRAQMPSINLVANISSSTDRHFMKVLNFHKENAHVLQDVKVNKIGGMLFINTAGHGMGSLAVKLRYNVLSPPEKICRFDMSINVSEPKSEKSSIRPNLHIKGNNDGSFDRSVIRGVANALESEDDDHDLGINSRIRVQRMTLAGDGLHLKGGNRSKRQAGVNDNKLVLKVSICARYLGAKTTEMSIVDVGIFSGFVPVEEDLKRLKDDPEHEIELYEKSKKGVVFYLKKVPNNKPYCFDFRMAREYIVGKTQRSSVKVYDYYNPDEACTTFYSPPSDSPLLRTLCDDGVCQCAEGGCPPLKPFEEINSFDRSEHRIQLRHIACENYDYVWKGQVVSDVNLQNGFLRISFQIEEVVKEGIEKEVLIEGDTRHFLIRDNCSPLMMNKTYLIMGKDGEKYQNEQGFIWHRYLLDQTSAVHLWTPIKTASDPYMQRILNTVVKKLKEKGCLQ